MEGKTTCRDALSRRDFVIGSAIALAMVASFALISSGLSLIVTFVPGVAFSWLIYARMRLTRTSAPASPLFLPIYFATLAAQFLHFAEEYLTGFRTLFPLLYGGAPYSDPLFVTFNMLSYTA